jgi:DNA/RNA endonuclease YhcR with UshA esterase domain
MSARRLPSTKRWPPPIGRLLPAVLVACQLALACEHCGAIEVALASDEPAAADAANSTDAITPEMAAGRVGQTCTVEMRVQRGRRGDSPICFLNSEIDFRDKKNFTVVVFEEGLAKFKKAGIDAPENHFEGKLIRVTGKVEKYRGRPQIRVDEPKQIEVVEEPADEGAAVKSNPK